MQSSGEWSFSSSGPGFWTLHLEMPYGLKGIMSDTKISKQAVKSSKMCRSENQASTEHVAVIV